MCSEKVTCEEWRDIQGYEGLYQVSNLGRIRSYDKYFYERHYSGCMAKHFLKGRVMSLHKRPNGYYSITLRNEKGEQKTHSVHWLVAIHFINKPNGKDFINHLDANPNNNVVTNLEWCTQSENIKYAYDNGTKIPPHQRKVGQCDLDGNLIKIWNSEADAGRGTGAYQANIYKVCMGKRQTAGGYKWQYIE